MPAQGTGKDAGRPHPSSARRFHRRLPHHHRHQRQTGVQLMNKPLDPRELQPFRVTTGPLPASQKLYSPAPGFPDVHVPYREISVHPSAKEPPLRVYDTTGPYTDPAVAIDVHEGLPRIRTPWI